MVQGFRILLVDRSEMRSAEVGGLRLLVLNPNTLNWP